MRIRILHVSDCPNVAVLEQRLEDVLGDGQLDVQVVREVVDSEDAAAAAGMAGSPTLLVDDADPFAEDEPAPSLSCRLYRDESGQLDRAPSTAQLRRALRRGQRSDRRADQNADHGMHRRTRLSSPGDD